MDTNSLLLVLTLFDRCLQQGRGMVVGLVVGEIKPKRFFSIGVHGCLFVVPISCKDVITL